MSRKKKFVLYIALIALLLINTLPVSASPKYMPDGTLFDSEYYAALYPDVVAVFGTTDENILYQHYVNYGRAEGRSAYGDYGVLSITAADPDQGYKDSVLSLTNANRQANGLKPLSFSEPLCKAAQTRANEIAASFSHVRPDGSSCFDILPAYNVVFRTAGENIAAGQPTPEMAVDSWMNSPGHRENIMNTDFSHLGVGFVEAPGTQYRYYWVQLFTD